VIQPVPFEIVEHEDIKVASNGSLRLTLLDSPGLLFKRRGIKGLSPKPAAESLLPKLNQLAGELLQQPEMPADLLRNMLIALAGTVQVQEPQRIEWAVVELDGVRVYTDGLDVIVTKQDLNP